jgi:hypothetical protein
MRNEDSMNQPRIVDQNNRQRPGSPAQELATPQQKPSAGRPSIQWAPSTLHEMREAERLALRHYEAMREVQMQAEGRYTAPMNDPTLDSRESVMTTHENTAFGYFVIAIPWKCPYPTQDEQPQGSGVIDLIPGPWEDWLVAKREKKPTEYETRKWRHLHGRSPRGPVENTWARSSKTGARGSVMLGKRRAASPGNEPPAISRSRVKIPAYDVQFIYPVPGDGICSAAAHPNRDASVNSADPGA